LERRASEASLKSSRLDDYRYVHFATHGLVNEPKPKLSGLMLAPVDSPQEDDILYLGEIYNLSLNADLVVLSACETGVGKLVKGEGLIGLTRGFLYAGAANLLVSLWQVNDASTANLMIDFYQNLLAGKSKAAALREAKLRLLEQQTKYAKPYHWAPFVLIGK
jgi:CHAT domain-containing protein